MTKEIKRDGEPRKSIMSRPPQSTLFSAPKPPRSTENPAPPTDPSLTLSGRTTPIEGLRGQGKIAEALIIDSLGSIGRDAELPGDTTIGEVHERLQREAATGLNGVTGINLTGHALPMGEIEADIFFHDDGTEKYDSSLWKAFSDAEVNLSGAKGERDPETGQKVYPDRNHHREYYDGHSLHVVRTIAPKFGECPIVADFITVGDNDQEFNDGFTNFIDEEVVPLLEPDNRINEDLYMKIAREVGLKRDEAKAYTYWKAYGGTFDYSRVGGVARIKARGPVRSFASNLFSTFLGAFGGGIVAGLLLLKVLESF